MGTTEWFRNVTWTEAVAAQFEVKLKRARRKEQYLRIQASTLANIEPNVAHSLLDRYFELPDQFDHAQAHVDRAKAYLAQARVAEAIVAYRAALSRELEFPNLLTQAYIDLPYLVAEQCVEPEYARALEVLDKHKTRLMFWLDHFKWNAAKAFILQALGKSTEAQAFASAALSAAAKEESGFQWHQTVGLVGGSYGHVIARLSRLHDA